MPTSSCRIVLAYIVVLLAACSGDDPLWELRPNVRVVRGGSTIETVLASDVDVDGNRIAVLRLDSDVRYADIEISDDRGVTWHNLWVPKMIQNELGGDSYVVGVHLEGGRVFLLISRGWDGIQSNWGIFEIDQTTGMPTEVVGDLLRVAFYPYHVANGRIRYMNGQNGSHTFVELDPATGRATETLAPCSGMACLPPDYRSADGGATFDGFSQPQANFDVCSIHYDVASGTSTQACVHRPVWPGKNWDYSPNIMYRGTTPYFAYSLGDQVYATTLVPGSPPTVSETLQLGPGMIAGSHVGHFTRPRFAEFELVDATDAMPAHLVHLTDAGPELVSFPLTPCTQDRDCGYEGYPDFTYGQVQWIQPTGEGDYWVFYTVQNSPDGNQQTMYVAREKPTFSPIVGAEPPPQPMIDLPEGSQPMNDLERACALYAVCQGYQQSFLFKQCIGQFMTTSATYPGMAAARARLLAGATNCTTLRAAYPDWFQNAPGCPLACIESGGNCGPNDTGPCTTEVPYSPSTCNTCDANGNFQICSQARAFNVSCTASGNVCSLFGCVLPGNASTCDAYNPTPSCQGNSVETCDYATNRYTVADCSLEGATCNPATAQCGTTSTVGTCNPATDGLTCNNARTALIGCAYGLLQYVPCTDFGFTECRIGSEGAYCH